MLILGIESTCDETACSIVRNGQEILSNVVSSQADLHLIYGGVVPELACRRHIEVIIPVIKKALEEAKITLDDIDAIAVAQGPGLIGALLIGVNVAKTLAWVLNKPLIGINHIEAHLYAALMSHSTLPSFPCLGAVLSGGHTSLVYMSSIGSYELLGQTVDDAIGEAFDKVAKLLDLPYPGGPQIEKLARTGDPKKYPFRSGHVKGRPLDFSFSGLKTAVLYAAKGPQATQHSPLLVAEEEKKHLSASFQHAAFSDIVKKTLMAAEQRQCRDILFGGGVTCNQRLREMFTETRPDVNYLWPSKGLTLDNAAMIAGLGYHRFIKGDLSSPLTMEAVTDMSFEK